MARQNWFRQHITSVAREAVKDELKLMLGLALAPQKKKRRRRRRRKTVEQLAKELHVPLKRRSPPTAAKSRPAVRGRPPQK